MPDTKKSHSKLSDSQIAQLARKALNAGRVEEAFELVLRVNSFIPTAQITLMMIAIVRKNNKQIRDDALAHFQAQIRTCTNPKSLIAPALWLQKPRGDTLNSGFIKTLESRRRELEPDWSGEWERAEDNNPINKYKDKKPSEVHNADICLMIAGQSSDWGQWMQRYVALGGDCNNPKYLKVYISKFFGSRKVRLPKGIKAKLKKYVQVVPEKTAIAFLKKLTPSRNSRKGLPFNKSLARMAMHLLVSAELNLAPGDWIHAAKAAQFLEDENVQRMILRALFEMERTPAVHAVFEGLVQQYGIPNPQLTAMDELRSRAYNPTLERLATLVPVDANARMILARYSEDWLC